MDTKSKKILAAFKKQGARIETKGRVKLASKKDFSLWYTPGVGVASLHLAKHPEDARLMSIKKNSVAIVSDGSAVLGLGNIGPYGALPVMVIIDAVTRLLPGVLGDEDSAQDESFSQRLLEYPQYTRPPEFRNWAVPEVLLSGNHAQIAKWRKNQSIIRTKQRRPDMIERAS